MNKTILKIFFCFTLSSAFIAIILLFINFLGLAFIQSDTRNLYSGSHHHLLLKSVESLETTDDGFVLGTDLPEGFWCMIIDENGDVIWDKDRPNDVPTSYSINDIAVMSRWFLEDYPIYVSAEDYGLFVMGTPKNSVGKYQIEYSMEWFDTLPRRILVIVIINLFLSTVLALIFGSTLYRRLRTLTDGIDALRQEKRVDLKEKGIFREISKSINETSRSMERKNAALLSRDNARSNWISGLSHDIRTPLSMVMGYSESLASSGEISDEDRKKARLITAQSLKIRKMIEDLNLISSLEYDMQPAVKKEFKICPLIRNMVTDLINGGLSEKYEINLDFGFEKAVIIGDQSLMERALFNLMNNSIVHNENGCVINISQYRENDSIFIKISDNGCGVPPDVIKNISVIPKSAHGLGLPMAYRIIAVHGGKMTIESHNGTTVLIELPPA